MKLLVNEKFYFNLINLMTNIVTIFQAVRTAAAATAGCQ